MQDFWKWVGGGVVTLLGIALKHYLSKSRAKFLHVKESLEEQIIQVPSVIVPDVRLFIEQAPVVDVMLKELSIRNMTDEKINDIDLVFQIKNGNHFTARIKNGPGELELDKEKKTFRVKIPHLKAFSAYGVETQIVVGTDSRWSEISVSGENEDWSIYHTTKKMIDNSLFSTDIGLMFLLGFLGVAYIQIFAVLQPKYDLDSGLGVLFLVAIILAIWCRKWIAKSYIKYRYWS